LPLSCPVTIISGPVPANAQTVAFEPMGLKKCIGSRDSAPASATGSKAGNGHTFCRLGSVEAEDTQSALMTHALFGDANDVLAGLVQRDALDRRRELPGVQALARLHFPQLHGVVGRAGDKVLGLGCRKREKKIRRKR
jgi:hypothetical protein